MHKLEIFNVGNGNSALITLENNRLMVVDFCDRVAAEDVNNPKLDLGEYLKDRFRAQQRSHVDVFAVTHLDEDHITGATEFFHLDHARKYQGDGRIKISTLWVPAGVLFESDLGEEARAIQAEARYRLRAGHGIRIFSRPEALRDWCARNGITFDAVNHLMTDAGRCAPEFSLANDGMEAFIHSPLARRIDGTSSGALIDRNPDCLVFQARFVVNGGQTDVLFTGDMTADGWKLIVDATLAHGQGDRLSWDLFNAPHHCSYKSIGHERGRTITEPTAEVKWLLEENGRSLGYIISSSEPIPLPGAFNDTSDQPPHRQAAAYYRGVAQRAGGRFLVTMEEPTVVKPKPLVFEIKWGGLRRVTVSSIAATIGSTPVGRAG